MLADKSSESQEDWIKNTEPGRRKYLRLSFSTDKENICFTFFLFYKSWRVLACFATTPSLTCWTAVNFSGKNVLKKEDILQNWLILIELNIKKKLVKDSTHLYFFIMLHILSGYFKYNWQLHNDRVEQNLPFAVKWFNSK